MYNSTELKSNGICQPIKDKVRSSSITIHRANKTQNSVQKYQWGFSFLQLYVVVILLALWSIGMGVLWKVSHDMLESNHREVASGNWKGLLDLAETIRMQVKDAGIDIDNLSDQQLEDEIQSVLHGGSVSSQHMPTNSFSISCWLWKSKWPVIVGILATVLMATEHALRPYSFGLYGYAAPGGNSTYCILMFVPLYTMLCLSVSLTVGNTLKQKFVVFMLSSGICVVFFFYSSGLRDYILPGTCLGLALAFAVGSSKGSRFVFFLVPLLCNYVVVLVLWLIYYSF